MVYLLSAVVFGLIVTAMAVGVLAGREPIRGTCGGINALGSGAGCELCGGDPARCDEEAASEEGAGKDNQALFYRADGTSAHRG